ncbi:MAG: DMT family transporter [Anaerolineaceae bacterium]|nr:DMT family transporter [Anaerolineaceae bacterium]
MASQFQKSNWKHFASLAWGILFVSTASIIIRFAQKEVSSLVIAGYRMTIASICLGVILLFNNPKQLLALNKRSWLMALLAGLFLALHFATWITSLEFTSVTSSVVLVTTTPIWVAMLSPLILKEQVTKNIILGLVIAIIGGIIVSLSNVCQISQGTMSCDISITSFFKGKVLLGNLLALFGAFMASGYMLVGRVLRKRIDNLPYTFIVYGISALLLDLLVIIRRENLFFFSRDIYIWLFALGIIPQLLGHSIFNWALKFIPASLVSIALLGEPIGSSILAFFILREAPTLIEACGGCLILLGIILASLTTKRTNVV